MVCLLFFIFIAYINNKFDLNDITITVNNETIAIFFNGEHFMITTIHLLSTPWFSILYKRLCRNLFPINLLPKKEKYVDRKLSSKKSYNPKQSPSSLTKRNIFTSSNLSYTTNSV